MIGAGAVLCRAVLCCVFCLQRKLESLVSDLQRQTEKFKERITALSNKVRVFCARACTLLDTSAPSIGCRRRGAVGYTAAQTPARVLCTTPAACRAPA
jgi:hypothetical protein